MNRYIFLILWGLVPLINFGQSAEISVHVSQSFSPQAKLYKYIGADVELVDSSWQKAPGTYEFSLKPNYQQGLYRVDVGKNIKINFIVANEPVIDIRTVVYAPNDSLKSLNSQENTVYWNYLISKKNNEQHLWLINSLKEFYNDSVGFFSLLKDELDHQKQRFNSFSKDLTSHNKDLLASKYIEMELRPEAHESQKFELSNKNLVNTWWGSIDLFDTRIMNSPALPTRLWSYVEQLFSDNLDKEEQDDSFINGIGALLSLEMHVDVKLYLRDVLIKGFLESDYKPVVEYLKIATFGELEPLKKSTPKILKSKHLPSIEVGDKAYDFSINLPSGKQQMLSEIDANYILLLFWSTWCPHCIESLPRINEVYNKYRDSGFEVVAISVDDEENVWRKYLSDMGLSWINIREPASRQSEMLYMYEVEETPKMFLLSKDLTIVSRPSTRRQLDVRLRKLFK